MNRGLKIIKMLFLFITHFLFIMAIIMAAVDFSGTLGQRDSSTWTGMLFLIITSVIGLPWSIGLWIMLTVMYYGDVSGQNQFPWQLWIGVFINYFLLVLLTKKILKGGENSKNLPGPDVNKK